MNLQSIIITNGIGITLILILGVSSALSRQRKSLETRLFSEMLTAIVLSCLMEAAAFIIDGRVFPGAVFLSKLFNTTLYLSNTSFALVWVLFVDIKLYHSRERLLTRYKPLYVITALTWVVTLANLFGNFLFVVDEKNVYSRTPLSYVFFLVPVLYVLISTVVVERYRRAHRGLHFFPIWTFLTPFFFGVLLQALFYGVSLVWCSVAIGLTALYLSLQNEMVYQDPLTRLYNRYYMNALLNSPHWLDGRSHSGIMIDIDSFKGINDTFGHSAGDEALRDTAQILLASAPAQCDVIRFAGDEFILLLMSDDRDEIRRVCAQIRAGLEAFNSRGERPYTLGLSLGSSIFTPGEMTVDDFLDAIDREMYEEKRRKQVGR